MASSSGSKISYILTFQRTSPRLTNEMMESIGLEVDEIVTTNDSALSYAFIHLLRKVRGHELECGMRTLAISHGVKESNIFGYEPITSNLPGELEPLEDNPAFKTLVTHEREGNQNFHRWIAGGFPVAGCGYNLLKGRLSAKSSAFRNNPDAASGAQSGRGSNGAGEFI